ncbi:hypothetical protein MRX96_057953 [Rhipicephalus microplus]
MYKSLRPLRFPLKLLTSQAPPLRRLCENRRSTHESAGPLFHPETADQAAVAHLFGHRTSHCPPRKSGPRPSQTATNEGVSHGSSATKTRVNPQDLGVSMSVGTGLSVHQQPSVQKNNHRKEVTTPKPTTSTTEFEIGVGLFVRPPVASGSNKVKGTRLHQSTKAPGATVY